MKRILFLLLLTVSVYGQNPSRFAKIQITGNANSGTATKVNVQEANGEVNTQTINTGFNKNIGLNSGDVVGATTLLNQYSTTPIDWTATTFNSGQVVFYGGKQWIAKMATVAGDVPAVSSKWDEITFEALANKTTTVDQTIIDGSTNSVSGNAVFDALATKSNIGHTHVASQITDLSKASVGLGNVDNTSDLSKPLSTATINALATKAPISSVHNPVTIGTANGLSLSTQQLSLGLASSSATGALSGIDWNTFNGKFNTPTGLTTNYLPKWNGSGFGNSGFYEDATGLNINGQSKGITFDNPKIGAFVYSKGIVHKIDGVNKWSINVGAGDVSEDYNIYSFDTSKRLVSYKTNGNIEFIPDGGRVLINKTNDDLTNQLQVNGTISASPATTANQVPTWGQVQAIARPYKVYTASIQQSGTSAPTATVLENTFGGTIVWTRTSVGIYTATLTGAFAFNKTICFVTSASANATNKVGLGITNANFVTLRSTNSSGVEADGIIGGLSIEIRVYP